MEALSHLYLPGALTIWCAVLFALAALWGYAQVLMGDESARPFARRAYQFFALAIGLASLVLVICLLRRDFRIEYVQQYSGLDLPTYFQVAAFWAGQKGSFLIWLLWAALLGLPLARSAGKDEAPVMGIYTLTALGLLFILVRENPFVMLAEAPADGKGLNPLLQDNWMVIHPPIMFVGYAAAAVPFAFAAAAMWRRDYSRWAARAFPWALGGFLVLGTAILMGGYWAYKTLGWGGFWGWDPVENASLIPWLLGTVLIHGLHMERAKGRYRRANLLLACLLYMSVLYGTFLTRSGVLADFSVHSFVDLGISGWLVALMASFGLISVTLLVMRWRSVPTAPNEDPLLSRGSFLMMSTIVVLLAAIVVAVGTSAPLLTRFASNPSQASPTFYNTVNFPLSLLIALLLSAVPYLTWRENDARELARRLRWPAVVAVLVTTGAALSAVRDVFHLLFVFLATLALASNLAKTVQLARNGGLKAAGGYLAHVGVGVILLGIMASTGYDESTKVTLEQGKPTAVGDLSMTFQRFVPRGELPDACGMKECMEVAVERGGERFLAYPKIFVNQRTRQAMQNPDIKNYLAMDLYISPLEFEPGVPAGGDTRVRLAQGESIEVGDATVRFLEFDLGPDGADQARLAATGAATVAAAVEVTRGGKTELARPILQLVPGRRWEAVPSELPGGGSVTLTALTPAEGSVVLALSGVASNTEPIPARLALDVTRKPLINLVWGGLYIVLAGGVLATLHRLKQALRLDRNEGPAAPAP